MSIEYYTAFDNVMGPFLSVVPKCEQGCSGCCAKKNEFIEKCSRSDFEPIHKQLLNALTTPSIADVLSALVAEETCFSSLSPSVSVPQSVLLGSQKTTTVKGTSSEPCEHCKKTSNRSENCFARNPKKLADHFARCAARGHGTGSTHICIEFV